MTGKRDGRIGSGVKVQRHRLADGTIKEYRYARVKRQPRKPEGDIRQLFNAYSESPEFAKLAPEWQARKLWLFRLMEETIGWMTISDLEDRSARTSFYELRDEHAKLPHRADKMMQTLCSALTWAYDRGILAVNQASRMKPLVDPRMSPHADKLYTPEQEEAILAKIPDDLRQIFLMGLYTGLRRGDLCRLEWSMLDKDGWLVIQPSKTRKTTGVKVHFPTRRLTPLAALIDELPRGTERMLMTAGGIRWQEMNLSFRWLRQMRALGLDGMRFHDIRHTTSNRLIDAGCTEAQRGIIMGNDVAGGSGRVYVARTRELATQAYRKWDEHMKRGAAVIGFPPLAKDAG